MPAVSFFLASTGAKIDLNPENTVCVMTMANKGCVCSNRPPTDSQVFNQICQARGACHIHKEAWTDLHSHAQYVHCRELTTLWVARLDYSAELKVTDPKEQQGDVEKEKAKGKKRQDRVDC